VRAPSVLKRDDGDKTIAITDKGTARLAFAKNYLAERASGSDRTPDQWTSPGHDQCSGLAGVGGRDHPLGLGLGPERGKR